MTPSIYLNLEDDVSRIVTRIKREKADKVVLVCPKRCFLFNDSINLRLLKKQVDLLKKEVFILTMDERGQMYAKDAGFQLKFLPKPQKAGSVSDISTGKGKHIQPVKKEAGSGPLESTVKEIKNIAKLWSKPKKQDNEDTSGKAEEHHKAVHHSPTVHHFTKISTPKVLVNDSIFPKEIEEAHKTRKKKAFNQKAVTGLVALSLILILAVVFVVLPKATVAVYPKSEPITRDLEVSIGVGISSPDPSRLVMPATKIDQTLEVSNKFQSQGKKEVGNKAMGTVQIYNFTRSPLNLKAGTTILTVGSKNYKLVSDISQLRPTAYKNSATKEVDASTLAAPVEVVAEQGGDSYNLPAGTRMEITNQVFGSKPQFLYAKTATSISGGTSRYLSVVSDQDVASSKTALEAEVLRNIQDQMGQKGLVLTEKAYTIEDLQFTTDRPAGTESPNFNASLKAKLTGLAFDSQDLHRLISDRISQTLSDNKILRENEPAMDIKLKNVDMGSGIAVLDVHFEGTAAYNVNIDDIASQLVGKTQNQVSEILRSKSEVDRIEITLAPSWQRNFPWFASKIKVQMGQESGNIE